MASRRKHDNDASSSGPPTKSELSSKNTRQIAFNRGQGLGSSIHLAKINQWILWYRWHISTPNYYVWMKPPATNVDAFQILNRFKWRPPRIHSLYHLVPTLHETYRFAPIQTQPDRQTTLWWTWPGIWSIPSHFWIPYLLCFKDEEWIERRWNIFNCPIPHLLVYILS